VDRTRRYAPIDPLRVPEKWGAWKNSSW